MTTSHPDHAKIKQHLADIRDALQSAELALDGKNFLGEPNYDHVEARLDEVRRIATGAARLAERFTSAKRALNTKGEAR